jgi:8-oxo-dGTP pyrophosphatase MutT (NUDIX family)
MTDDFHGEPEAFASPTELAPAGAGYVRQAGAICLRYRKGRDEVLLIRGLRSGKWGIPKGGVEAGETTSEAAAREAFEEAGVSGRCETSSLGYFEYRKQGKALPCRVSVHLLEVLMTSKTYPEMHIRTPCWTDRERAVELVDDEGLKRLFQLL